LSKELEMSKPKKSRAGKKHRAITIVIPALFNVISIRQEEPMLAMKIYGQIAGFIHEPTGARYDDLCEMLTIISMAYTIKHSGRSLAKGQDPESVTIVSAMSALMDILNRARRLGAMTVSAVEAKTLNAAAGGLDVALEGISVPLWNEAKAVVTRRTTEIAISINQIVRDVEENRALALEAA
jgi:hypothetical protein